MVYVSEAVTASIVRAIPEDTNLHTRRLENFKSSEKVYYLTENMAILIVKISMCLGSKRAVAPLMIVMIMMMKMM